MIEPMAKLRLVCPRSHVERVTAVLHETGVLHIETESPEGTADGLRQRILDEPAGRHRAELERLRDRLTYLLTVLPPVVPVARSGRRDIATGQTLRDLTSEAVKRAARHVPQIENRVKYVTDHLKHAEDEFALIAKYSRALEAFAPFLRHMKDSEHLAYLGLILERQPAPLAALREMMDDVTSHRYELVSAPLGNDSLAVLLIVPKAKIDRVRRLLMDEGVPELQLPTSVSAKPLGQALRIVLKKRLHLPGTIQRLRDAAQRLSKMWREELESWAQAVNARLEQVTAHAAFYETDMASFVYGWIPSRRDNEFQRRLREEFGSRVVIEEVPVERGEWNRVPVLLRNPGYFKPFEVFTRLVDVPRYGSIDPTPLIAVFFPLFFGAMLGDLGYGLLLLGGIWIVRRTYRDRPFVEEITAIGVPSAMSAALFGVLYGECFGTLGERIGMHPVVDRMEAYLPILIGSIGVGVVHVSLAVLLGIITAWRHKEWREFLVKVGGFVLVLSFAGLLAAFAGMVSRAWTPWLVGAIGCSGILIVGAGGARSAMEFHNVVNVLSYLRIMGIGLASAALAFTANTLGGLAGSIVVGVAIGVVLHALNFLFGVLSPTIQSLRLHYVEFFENFFVSGGRPYEPFKRVESVFSNQRSAVNRQDPLP